MTKPESERGDKVVDETPVPMRPQAHGGALRTGGRNAGGGAPPRPVRLFCVEVLDDPEVQAGIWATARDPTAPGYGALMKLIFGYAYGLPMATHRVDTAGQGAGARIVYFMCDNGRGSDADRAASDADRAVLEADADRAALEADADRAAADVRLRARAAEVDAWRRAERAVLSVAAAYADRTPTGASTSPPRRDGMPGYPWSDGTRRALPEPEGG